MGAAMNVTHATHNARNMQCLHLATYSWLSQACHVICISHAYVQCSSPQSRLTHNATGTRGAILPCLMQSFMFAVYEDASQNIQNATGPIDDGYITNVVGALPGDALCCAGPEPLDDGEQL